MKYLNKKDKGIIKTVFEEFINHFEADMPKDELKNLQKIIEKCS